LAEAQRQADEALAATIAKAMKVYEPPKSEADGPYLDDDGTLRDPSGHVVDVLGTAAWCRRY
jgi:hypothetical protein